MTVTNFISALSGILSSTGAAIVSVGGAIAAWLPFYVKKPQLSLNIFVKAAPIPQNMGGIKSSSNAWHLVIRVKNNGDKTANNVSLKLTTKFWDSKSGKLLSQPEMHQKISGDLTPTEEIEILIPVNNNDTTYPYNHILVTLNFQDSLPWRWRNHKRSSTWFFNVMNGTRVSEDMHRIDKVNHIPADLWA